MSKKKQKSVSSNTPVNFEELALSQVESGDYKEAIASYKKLWQDSDNDKWRRNIAHCYLQRALTFASRGMVKEALVLWDNHTQYVESPYPAYDHYVSWMIQTNNQAGIQSCLKQLSAQQLDKDYPELAILLGFLMIADHPEFQQDLPQDSTFMIHFGLVQSALSAYQDNDLDQLNSVLKKLPYRSAFRDFRTLINAVLQMPKHIEQAQQLLAKIQPPSPYSHAAQLLIASTKDGLALTQSLQPFSHKQQRIVGGIKGLNKKQLAFMEQIIRHQENLNDKLKFNLAIQYQSLCGTEIAQRFCQAQLATYPKGQRDFNKKFSVSNAFEENRIKALKLESEDNSFDAEYFWELCIQKLMDEGADNDLKIALILRRIARYHESEELVELLVESLLHDADDRDTHLKILQYYCQQSETFKEYKQWLSKTLEKFPQDIEVLTLAINTAIQNKAYKKASHYASKILKVDSLNVFAKKTLFLTHTAHARRLLQKKQYHLVEKEIKLAEAINSDQHNVIKIQLLRGMLCFAEQDKQQGLQIIVDSFNTFNVDPVNSHFQAAMEAQLTGLPVATILRELPSTSDYVLSSQELIRFIEQIEEYAKDEDKHELLNKALEKIKRQLKNALKVQAISEEELLTLCQIFDDINHFELLRHCVKYGIDKWDNPIWDFYQVYADVNGIPEKCSPYRITYLEDLREQAMNNNQHRAVIKIDRFVQWYYRAHSEGELGFIDDLFRDDEQEADIEDPLELLFGHIPEKVLKKLNKKLESLLKITSPEVLVKQLKQTLGDDQNVLNTMMQEPDIFMALLMLKAADELGIDIDVSVGDVLDCFSVDKQTDIFSFPF